MLTLQPTREIIQQDTDRKKKQTKKKKRRMHMKKKKKKKKGAEIISKHVSKHASKSSYNFQIRYASARTVEPMVAQIKASPNERKLLSVSANCCLLVQTAAC